MDRNDAWDARIQNAAWGAAAHGCPRDPSASAKYCMTASSSPRLGGIYGSERMSVNGWRCHSQGPVHGQRKSRRVGQEAVMHRPMCTSTSKGCTRERTRYIEVIRGGVSRRLAETFLLVDRLSLVANRRTVVTLS